MQEEFGSNARRKKMTIRLVSAVYDKLEAYCRSFDYPPTHNAVIEKALIIFLHPPSPSGKSRK